MEEEERMTKEWWTWQKMLLCLGNIQWSDLPATRGSCGRSGQNPE